MERLEGWGQTVVEFGKCKGLTFAAARYQEMHVPSEPGRRNANGKYISWVIERAASAPDYLPMNRFARYLLFKRAIEQRMEAEEARAHEAQLQQKRQQRKKGAEARARCPRVPKTWFRVCGQNFDDKESLFIACDACNAWSHARCFSFNQANMPKHFVRAGCQSAIAGRRSNQSA